MTAIEKLEALYALLPKVQCQRKCQRYCGPILMTRMEASRLEQKRGYLNLVPAGEIAKRAYLPTAALVVETCVGIVPDPREQYCPFLGPFPLGQCMAYSIRPLVCRAWGTMNNEQMRCPHGCVPERWLTNEEFRSYNLQAIAIQKEWEAERAAHASKSST